MARIVREIGTDRQRPLWPAAPSTVRRQLTVVPLVRPKVAPNLPPAATRTLRRGMPSCHCSPPDNRSPVPQPAFLNGDMRAAKASQSVLARRSP